MVTYSMPPANQSSQGRLGASQGKGAAGGGVDRNSRGYQRNYNQYMNDHQGGSGQLGGHPADRGRANAYARSMMNRGGQQAPVAQPVQGPGVMQQLMQQIMQARQMSQGAMPQGGAGPAIQSYNQYKAMRQDEPDNRWSMMSRPYE